jgi:sugar phosphate permease
MIHEEMKNVFPYRWLIFCSLAAQYLVVYFHRNSPAVVASELIDTFFISGVSMSRAATPREIAYAVAFAASNGYMTEAMVNMIGGLDLFVL